MKKIILQSSTYAFVIGTLLALYISLTMFFVMPHKPWLALHNLLIVSSLVLAAFIGYQNRRPGLSMSSLFISVGIFFLIVMVSNLWRTI
ncbi:MAG TPA: hypothetical protein VFC02_14585 [Anaerolineales bacterium]|nr:hypothetical protein [Anaerolineales bacterium]